MSEKNSHNIRLFGILLIAFLLFGCTTGPVQSPAGSPGTVPQQAKSINEFVCKGGATSSIWTAVTPAIAAAIGASIVLLVAIYLYAIIFSDASLTGYVKLEIFELIISVIIITMLGSALIPACNLTLDVIFPNLGAQDFGRLAAAGSPPKLYEVVERYYEANSRSIETWMQMEYVLNMWLDQLASVTPYSRPLGVGIVATPFAGLASPLKQMAYNIFVSLSIALIINSAQKEVFVFAVVAFLKVYLPLGIFLRSFTPTRRIGGTLIALAIGFVFIFPILSTFPALMVYGKDSPIANLMTHGVTCRFVWLLNLNKPDPATGIPYPDCPAYDETKASTVTFTKKGIFGDVGPNNILTIITVGFSQMLGGVFRLVTGEVLGTILLLPLSATGMAFLVGFLLPALNLIFLVQSIKYLSRVLGEEIDVTSLTRLI